jgi:hypothetical protein
VRLPSEVDKKELHSVFETTNGNGLKHKEVHYRIEVYYEMESTFSL